MKIIELVKWGSIAENDILMRLDGIAFIMFCSGFLIAKFIYGVN